MALGICGLTPGLWRGDGDTLVIGRSRRVAQYSTSTDGFEHFDRNRARVVDAAKKNYAYCSLQ